MSRNAWLTVITLVTALLWTALGDLPAGDNPVRPIEVGPRPTSGPSGLPIGWRQLELGSRPRTTYRMTEEAGVPALEASADESASILYTHVSTPVESHSVLSWRWGIQRTPHGADVLDADKDDAAARLFVAFEHRPELIPRGQRFRYWLARVAHGEYPPYSALCYVWSRTRPVGTVSTHHKYCRLVRIVIRRGDRDSGRWVEERRDVLADYTAAFGTAPPAISHIAVMTDTDETGDSLKAWYSGIALYSADSVTRAPAPPCKPPPTPPCTGDGRR